MSDIIERLEEEILHASRKSFDSQQAGINANFLMDIQSEIERLRSDIAAVTAERDRMREALKPFASELAAQEDEYCVWMGRASDYTLIETTLVIKIGDLRAARAALEGVTVPAKGESNG